MGLFKNHTFDETILAQGKKLTLDTWESGLNNNIALIGASGRGKTRHFIKPNIMQMNCSYVISDPKGTLIKEVGTMLENNGYKVKILNLVDMCHSGNYNPFYYIKRDSDVLKLVKFIMENVSPSERCCDPFWPLSAQALISAVCLYLVNECNTEDQTFYNVMKLLQCHRVSFDDVEEQSSTLDLLFKDLEERSPNCLAVKQYKVFKSAGGGKTASSILISAEVDLQFFNLAEYANLTCTDTLELEKISQEKTALFVVTSDTDSSKDWLVGVFYSQLFDLLCNQQNKYHVRFFLDDFACTGKIPDFERKMSMIRSRNLSCVVVLQDEAQLEVAYGRAAKEIISNCDTYVFLGSTNIDSCNIAAKRLCDAKISGTDIRKMGKELCVVVCGNEGGIYRKYELKKHPRYSEIADDENSPMKYNLEEKHCTYEFYQNNPSKTDTNDNGPVWKKPSIFDSFEEKYLYSIISQITNLSVYPHQHLRDIFATSDVLFSKKLTNMHCDFVVRDKDMNVLFGIEIDGMQHESDPRQFANDTLKNSFFSANEIPLLRVSASDVRNNAQKIVSQIIEAASEIDKLEHTLAASIPSFNEEKGKEMSSQKETSNATDKTPALRRKPVVLPDKELLFMQPLPDDMSGIEPLPDPLTPEEEKLLDNLYGTAG